MRVLVTGGAGFLGSNLVRKCLEQGGVEVTVLDSLEPRLFATLNNLRGVLDKVHFIEGDIRDSRIVDSVVATQDIIFNCAAQTSHPLSLQDPAFDAEVNCVGTLRLLESVRRSAPEAVVVYPSSSTAIGKATAPDVDEDHPEAPLEIYSANKGVAENYHEIFHRVHGLKTVILRFANLYGPYGKARPEFSFINYFISLAAAGNTIELYGSGEQMRNVMFVDDATDIMWLAAAERRLDGQTYFATSDEHVSVVEVASAIVAVFEQGRVVHIPWPEERKRIEVDGVRFSSARLRKIVNWNPRFTLQEGLARTRAVMRAEGQRL